MRQIQQIIYIIPLYLQFFVRDVFTFNIDILSKEKSNNTNNIIWISEWKCNSNQECTATNSTCNNHLCQCAPGYIFNTDMTACIEVATKLHDSCNETIQCSTYLLSGAKCIKNICKCGPGYYYLHGRCNRYVGLFETCKQNIDCYVNADFEASTCDTVKGICKCSPGFYQREYRTCRREGKEIGDECTIDIDCSASNMTCNQFACSKKESDKTIELLSDIMFTTNNTDKEIWVGSNCTINEDCRELGNAICSSAGTCRCDRAHFASDTDTECIPELGESCQDDDVGYIKNSFCRGGRWSCTNGTVVSKDNRECLEAIRKYKGKCDQDEQCYIFGPDAVCSNNECVCNESVSHYVENELLCWVNKGVDENCIQNQDCYVKDFKGKLICNDKQCGCPIDTILSRDKMSCVHNSTELGGVCEIDDNCETANSVCEEGVCICDKNYYESEKQCLAGINSTCIYNEECTPKDSMCVSEVCVCKSNYVAVTIKSCIPISSYGESCSLDIQCSINITGAICATTKQNEEDTAYTMESPTTKSFENKVCACKEGYHYKLGHCLKNKFLDETCTNHNECCKSRYQELIVCRNGKCMCDWGYREFNDSFCVKRADFSKFFLSDGASNVISTGLLSIILCVLSCKLF